MRLYLYLLFILPSLSTFSQENNNWILGGGLSFGHSTNSTFVPNNGQTATDKTSHFVMQPYIGKVINEKWTLGVTTRYEHSIIKIDLRQDNNVQKTISNGGQIGLFARCLLKSVGKLQFLIEPTVVFARTMTKITQRADTLSEWRTIALGTRIDPILTYQLTPKLRLLSRIGLLSFESGNIKTEGITDKTAFSNFQTVFNLNGIQFGLECTLGA